MNELGRNNKGTGAGPAVSLRNLVYAWDGQEPLLDIGKFDIGVGESLFIRGASGSGKSTLLGLLGGVLTPTSGSVTVLGRDVGGMKSGARDRFRADHFGIIFQMFNLLPYLSVMENTLLPCRFSSRRRQNAIDAGGERQEAERLLSALGLASDTWMATVTSLSVGQQQRVAAARALIGSPELIVADEPTSALDTIHRGRFIDLLKRECERSGATLVFVSHDETLSGSFDRTVDLAMLNACSTQVVA